MVLLARGHTTAEIAAALSIRPATAQQHIAVVMSKLGARDRTQLVVMAYESGLVHQGQRPEARAPQKVARLTPRERKVMVLLAWGLTTAEIASRLSVDQLAVGTHIRAILAKVGARVPTELVVMAYESGLVRPLSKANTPAADAQGRPDDPDPAAGPAGPAER
jgi:DNA-binding NarL/FixJ family response regulator